MRILPIAAAAAATTAVAALRAGNDGGAADPTAHPRRVPGKSVSSTRRAPSGSDSEITVTRMWSPAFSVIGRARNIEAASIQLPVSIPFEALA